VYEYKWLPAAVLPLLLLLLSMVGTPTAATVVTAGCVADATVSHV
jgi:hypothetical protein